MTFPIPITDNPNRGGSSHVKLGRCAEKIAIIRRKTPTLAPGDALEVHFALSDGSWTEWQSVEASYEEHLEADVNGPGCDCTWLSVTLAPTVVPEDARLSPQGEYLSL